MITNKTKYFSNIIMCLVYNKLQVNIENYSNFENYLHINYLMYLRKIDSFHR